MRMRSETLGAGTSDLEVTNISKHGLWVLRREEELFLPYTDFPWFKHARVSAILNVELTGGDHLYWPDLDVDLTLESIRNPEKYPLVSRVGT
jgi:hypothetical protein